MEKNLIKIRHVAHIKAKRQPTSSLLPPESLLCLCSIKISFFCTICSLSRSSSVHPFCIFLRYFHFFDKNMTAVFFSDQRWKLIRHSYMGLHFKHKIFGGKWTRDWYCIFTGKHIKNISLCSYRILLSTI